MDSATTKVINNPEEAIESLGDEYSIRILSETLETERSAKEISRRLDIPIATVYRRIDNLVEAGFLEYEGKALTQEGKRVKVYRSYVDQIKIFFESNEPRVEIQKYSDPQKTIDQAWRNIKNE
ncbi:MAG: helix-turn-helix domain-containing protein [Halobacteria archaeon]|nr:helix-turn-helix domain-containing protein [Halobacteria archaeon]